MVGKKTQNAAGGADWQTGYRHGSQGKENKPPTSVKYIEDYAEGYQEGLKEKKARENFRNSTSFENGRQRAAQEIRKKIKNAAR